VLMARALLMEVVFIVKVMDMHPLDSLPPNLRNCNKLQ
jgi:hypothetical protein